MNEFRFEFMIPKWPRWIINPIIITGLVSILILFLFGPAAISIIFKLSNFVTILMILFSLASIFYLFKTKNLWKLTHRFEELTFELSPSYLHIPQLNLELKWSDIVWYRHDNNGAIHEMLIIKAINHKKLKLAIHKSTTSSNPEWRNFIKILFQTIDNHGTNVRNYYDSPFWTALLWILPSSIILIPIGLSVSGLDWTKSLGALVMWTVTVITTTMMILTNRDK